MSIIGVDGLAEPSRDIDTVIDESMMHTQSQMQVQSVMAGMEGQGPFEGGIPISTEPITFSEEKKGTMSKAIRYDKKIDHIITDRELA